MHTRRKSRRQSPKSAICIPCVPEDISLSKLCFDSIRAQIRKPEQVVVSLSSATEEDKQELLEAAHDLPIKVLMTHEKVLAGGNRNRAAAEAVKHGATILHFFDADDIMHPEYVEIVENAFRRHPITGFLHAGIYVYKRSAYRMHKKWRLPHARIFMNPFRSKTFASGRKNYGFTNGFQALHGHLSILSRYWKDNKYDETLRLNEDKKYNWGILESGENIGYTPSPISYYTIDAR